MARYFFYGTFQPGERHHALLDQFKPQIVGRAILTRGNRVGIRYRGCGDDRFDRTRHSHYAEPVLIPDRTSKERIVGTVIDIDSNELLNIQFARVIGQSKGYPVVPLTTECGMSVLAHVRFDTGDLCYKTDPGLYRFDDNRVQFCDASTFVFEPSNAKLPSGLKRNLVGRVEAGKLYEIAVSDLYVYDIRSDTNRRRAAVNCIHPTSNRDVPAFVYVNR